MAQTYEEILEEINQAQADQVELNGLTSVSSVSVFSLIKNMFALLSLTLQKSFDLFRTEINTLIVSQQIGTLPWYVDMMKKFQYGDTIFVEDNNIVYATENEEARIIAQASASEILVSNKSELLLKAVKQDSGLLVPLTVDEKESLSEYVNLIKFAGVTVNLISEEADVIKLNMTVELNLLMVNSDGSAIGNPTSFPVKEAIVSYFRNLPFDGTLYWNKLIDHLQAMPQVKDAIISESWSLNVSTYTPFTRLYNSYSGHLLLDDNSEITYV